MKKLLRYADMIILLCATAGMLLQGWLRLTGTDDRGLYNNRHPGWILSLVLSLAVLVFIWLLTRQVGDGRSHKANFPPSRIGALGCIAAAAALVIAAVSRLQSSTMWLDTLAGFLGLASSAGLLIAADNRLRGGKPPFFCYMLPCAFFALQVFYLGWKMGGEPEAVRYLFPMLATLSLIPASYQLWGFCVGSGDRQKSLFWSLLAGFLCLVSAPISTDGLMYFALGLWMLSNPCALKYLSRRSRPIPQDVPEQSEACEAEAQAPEIPCTMEEDLLPTPEPESQEPEPKPELDADSIIAEILREIDSNIQ